MEFQDVLRHRRMVRTFQSRSVPDATLHRLLRMARRAPSAGHTQPLELVVVRAPEVRRRLAAATWSRGGGQDERGAAVGGFCGLLPPFILTLPPCWTSVSCQIGTPQKRLGHLFPMPGPGQRADRWPPAARFGPTWPPAPELLAKPTTCG